MRITIRPNIEYIGKVINYGLPEGSRVYNTNFIILSDDFVINIKAPPETIRGIRVSENAKKKMISKRIRDVLFNRLFNLIKNNAGVDISAIMEDDEDHSPPIKIYWEDDESANPNSIIYDEVSFKRWLKDNIVAQFQILRTNNQRRFGTMSWGQERVWYNAPKSLSYNNNIYSVSETGLTCAYDYLITHYRDVAGYKKSCKDKDTIDHAISLPRQHEPKVFNEWLCLYQDEIRLSELIPSDIHYLPNCVDIDSLKTEFFEVVEQGYKGDYNKKEIDETLSVIDLIKWGIHTNTRVIIYDYDNTHYCSYNPNDFKQIHNEIKVGNKNTIVLKVADNHAYFVDDKNVKISASKSDTNYTIDAQPYSMRGGKDKKKKIKKLESKYHNHPIKSVELDYDDIQDLGGIDENATFEEWNELKWKLLQGKQNHLLLENPPPTIETLKEWAFDEDYIHHYSVDKPNLNGLVNYIYKNVRVEVKDKKTGEVNLVPFKPKSLIGSAKTIQVATYNNLKIYSTKRKPKTDNEGGEYEKLYKLYPELKSEFGILPTTTKIATEIFNGINKDNIMSMFNKQTRRIFFDCEVKPFNTGLYEAKQDKDYSEYPVYSIDLKRAYTSAIMNNDTKYQVYDSVSQPQVFQGDFKSDYFYLCYNRVNTYPCKRGKGLILYHGSYLRNIRDKVIIKYYIKPKEELQPNLFIKFVEKVRELIEKDIINNISDKELINCFIGSLKKKDGIKEFKHFITPSKITAHREILRNKIPTRLDHTTICWEKEPMLISSAKKSFSFISGQPIRLAVIDLINEQIFKLHTHYKVCLNSHKFITNWTNNIKQRKILKKIRNKNSVPAKYNTNNINHTPSVISINTDALYISMPYKCAWKTIRERRDWDWIERREMTNNKNDKFINYVVDTWNNNNEYKVELESKIEWDAVNNFVVESDPQYSYNYIRNRWKYNKEVKTAWEIDKDYDWKSKLIREGGLVDGWAGCGKSELIREIKNRCRKNKAKYRWLRVKYRIYKKMTDTECYELLEEWRDENPCVIKTFCPTNKSSNRVDMNWDRSDKIGDSSTLHKGLGIPFKEDIELEDGEEADEIEDGVLTASFMDRIIEGLEGCNYSTKGSKQKKGRKVKPRCDIIFIDEVSMCGGNILSYLSYIKMRIPTIRFIVCGDIPHQLPPIQEEYRNFYNSYCLKELTNFNKINLNYNFRSGITSSELWEWSDTPHKFKELKGQPITDRNLCWTNKTRKKVINILQDRIRCPVIIDTSKYSHKIDGHNDVLKYNIGTPLIASKSDKDKLGTCKNEMYYVVGLEPIKLFEPVLQKTIFVEDEEQLIKNFLSGYCITIHKSQGETYDDEYTIHDWGKISQDNIVKRKLRYVGQSRSSNPENNIYYKL